VTIVYCCWPPSAAPLGWIEARLLEVSTRPGTAWLQQPGGVQEKASQGRQGQRMQVVASQQGRHALCPAARLYFRAPWGSSASSDSTCSGRSALQQAALLAPCGQRNHISPAPPLQAAASAGPHPFEVCLRYAAAACTAAAAEADGKVCLQAAKLGGQQLQPLGHRGLRLALLAGGHLQERAWQGQPSALGWPSARRCPSSYNGASPGARVATRACTRRPPAAPPTPRGGWRCACRRPPGWPPGRPAAGPSAPRWSGPA
jgi:hypothetical protein